MRLEYAASASPNAATVAGFAIGVGWTSAMTATLVAVALTHGPETQWTVVGVGIAIVAIQGLIMLVDLKRLVGEAPVTPSPLKTLMQMLFVVVAVAIIGHGLGAGATFHRPLLFVSVLIVAAIGNELMIGAIFVAAIVALGATVTAAGASVSESVALLCSYGAASAAASIMIRDIRNAAIRAAARFDMLAETTEVILRAEGFSEAVNHFLPLVAAQVGATSIHAFTLDERGRSELLDSWMTGDVVHEQTVPDRLEWRPPDEGTNGYAISTHACYIWARTDDGRVAVIVAYRPSASRRWRVSIESALGRLAPELELLATHTDFVTQLEARSRTDALTGLPNRLQLLEKMEEACSATRRRNEPLVVAMIDLDEFKSYNDTFGHLEGDRALAGLGQLFKSRMRVEDFLCRYGGEEFVVIMQNTSLEGAEHLLSQLRTLAGALPALRPLSFSAGISQWDGSTDVDALLRDADSALYAAKAAGRHRTVASPVRSERAPHASPDTAARAKNVKF